MKVLRISFWLICAMPMILFAQNKPQLKLSALFSDNMVLQQQTEVPIWGWAGTGKEVRVTTTWNSKTYKTTSDDKGKWRVLVQTIEFGGPFTIEISEGNQKQTIQNVLLGDVWLCSGQSNMEMPLKGFPGQPVIGANEAIVRSTNEHIRFIQIPRAASLESKENFEGQWYMAAPKSVANFSATAYFFAEMLQDVLKIPIGLIEVDYGGSNVEAWMSSEMLKEFESVTIPTTLKNSTPENRTATLLFNGMLSPVIGYGIKGCIWYQGESNYENPKDYKALFSKMVDEWRQLWGQGDFPFYFAQIAPFDYSRFHPDETNELYNSAYLREAQLAASKEIPNSGIAILMDVGEFGGIHPMHKKPGGQRLAYQALAKTYGYSGFEYESPTYKAMEIKDNSVIVSFDNVESGLTSYHKDVNGFEIAGKDKKFYPATAVLRSKSVIVSAPEVQNPVAVRYLFKDYAQAELFSAGGLPVSSFRSDDW